MFYKSLTVSSFLILVSLSSFAQTGGTKTTAKPKPTPTASAKSAVAPLTLSEAKTFAETEVARLKQELAKASGNPALQPCDYYAMKAELKYNEWFVEPAHYQEFERMSSSVESSIATVNAKLASLENETVNVLVREGQSASSSETPVALKDLVNFCKLYDQRMKSCPKDQYAVLKRMMEEDAEATPVGIVLSQVTAAGGMMSVNLNASLQEQNTEYQILMTQKECGYNLELIVKMELNGARETYRFSLLDNDPSAKTISLGEKAKWEMLSKGKIDGMPVDGLLRYRKIQDQYFKGQCNQEVLAPSRRYGAPYIKHSDISAIMKEMEINKESLNLIKGPVDHMNFVYIASGTFQMGSPASEAGRDADELLHNVTLTQDFEMQTTEVTQAQWYKVMNTHPSYYSGDNLPVEQVTWEDAQRFIQKLNELDQNYIYRLPTEAEWEYAARGGTSTAFFNGDNSDEISKVASLNNYRTSNVAGGAANEFGLYDMHGNVWEWVQDWEGAPGTDQDQIDPKGPSSGSKHMARGGSWNDTSASLRSANRGHGRINYNSNRTMGFRIVRTPK